MGHTRMFFHKAGLSDQEAKKILENPKIILSNIDLLVEELKDLYQPNELSAWLRLLIDKKTIEGNLSITVKASLKKTRNNLSISSSSVNFSKKK